MKLSWALKHLLDVLKKKGEMVDEGHHKLHLAGAHLSQFPEALTIKSPMR